MSKKMLKRSLALGALMAFVITGSAWAADRYKEVGGNETIVTIEQDTGHDTPRLTGGFAETNVPGNITNDLTTNIKVVGGNWDVITGGHFVANLNGTIEAGVQNTVVIIDGANAEQVYAGTSGYGADGLTIKEGTAELIIKSGIFGQNYNATTPPESNNVNDSGNCPEFLVVGGNLLKIWKNDGTARVSSNLESTNTVIEGGKFNSAIVGGSAAIQYYSGNEGIDYDVSVETASTTITGGQFNHVIVAGGFAYAEGTTSNITKEAILNISGAKNEIIFKDNIYAGGMTGDWGVDGVETLPPSSAVASVVKTTINIDNATIKGVYGNGVYVGQKNPAASPWTYVNNANSIVNTTLSLTNVIAETVDITLGSVTLGVAEEGNTNIATLSLGDKVGLAVTVDGTTNDAIGSDTEKIAKYIEIGNANTPEEKAALASKVTTVTLEAGDATDKIILRSDGKGGFTKDIIANKSNTGISDINSVALMSWRAETNDMNKRLGELRNANGEHGVWVRMVRGESEYNSVNHQYNQYQLGYDEKLSVDPSWTVGAAYTYTDAESSFSKGSGENTHKGLAIYGSKLNDDGSFIDLIAKYSRLEHDFDLGTAKGDYSTNGYSVSAEYGKRLQQGNGLWIEPQIELTYGKISSAEYMVGKRNIIQDGIESLVGRVGFSLGKDINQGNVYARASYLYDFDGETEARFAAGGSDQAFEQDLGGGWWEVGVGANINLSKATYIYADIEKTFGGEVDTNWQWNLGFRYSF